MESVLKHKLLCGYVQIPNDIAQSRVISAVGKAILLELISRPTDWKIIKSQLTYDGLKMPSLTKALAELQGLGYMKIATVRSADGRKICGRQWIVSDAPIFLDKSLNTHICQLRDVSTETEGALQRQIAKANTKKEKETKKYLSSSPGGDGPKESSSPQEGPLEGFNEFWQAYPRKVGKGAARRVWDKISPDTGLQTILDQVARQRETEQWADPKYVPHPATWLNQQRWLDEPDPPSTARVYDRDGYDQEGYDIHGNTRYGTHALSLQELFAMYQARGQFREIDCYQWERASDEFQRRMKAEGREGAPSFGIPSDQHEGLIMAIVREQEEADRQKNGPPLKGNG